VEVKVGFLNKVVVEIPLKEVNDWGASSLVNWRDFFHIIGVLWYFSIGGALYLGFGAALANTWKICPDY